MKYTQTLPCQIYCTSLYCMHKSLTLNIFIDVASSSSFGNDSVNTLLLTELIYQFDVILHHHWDCITQLAHEQDANELDWLLCLFTACDPYSDTECQFDQGDYSSYVTYLLDPATWPEEKEDSSEDELHELEDEDFIALDEDRGFHLRLPPGLYDILFSRERPLGPPCRN